MAWWWPFGRKKVVLPPPPDVTHQELASEFFWMRRTDQLQFFWLLEFGDCRQGLAKAKAFPDVEAIMRSNPAPTDAANITAEQYVLRLKSLIKAGKRYVVEAAMQNFFENRGLAVKYTDFIDHKWKG